ncbi:MAG TPA: hypothetical protein VGM36_01310 [Rhizomicrobium sp.]|jgi:hypothetical protein
MMPQINISQPLFSKLQMIAEPFVDTPETAIAKAVEFYLSHNKASAKQSPNSPSNVGEPALLVFQADAPPDLTFTRPLSVELEGMKLPKAKLYWNPLLFEVVRIATSKTESTDKLKQLLLCNYVDGEGDQKLGYNFIREAKLSVQAQSANPAWKSIAHLAKALGLKLEVTFIWEDKPNAAYPTKMARMTVGS